MKNQLLEQTCYKKAQSILEDKIKEHPVDALIRSSHGIAYAGLGLKEEAIREEERAVKLLLLPKAIPDGGLTIQGLARIYVLAGKYVEAIDKIKYLLSVSGRLSIPLIQGDPSWNPLRDHPRFIKLLSSSK